MKRTILGAAVAASICVAGPAVAANHTAGTSSRSITVTAHGVLVRTTMPTCANEDSSGGVVPCAWNINGPHKGDGLALWYDVHRHAHYVWPLNPVQSNVGPRLRWVGSALADALAEGGTHDAGSRNWEHCVWQPRPGHPHKINVACPDGLVIGGVS